MGGFLLLHQNIGNFPAFVTGFDEFKLKLLPISVCSNITIVNYKAVRTRSYSTPFTELENRKCIQITDTALRHLQTAGASNTEASPESEDNDSHSTRPRPVIARFVSCMDAEMVWERRKNLMKSRFSSVFIDNSAESAKEREKLCAAYKKAKEAGIEQVFIRGNKLFVNSSSYSVDALPEYLLPADNRVGNLNFSALALWASDIKIVLARVCFHSPNTSFPPPPSPTKKK